MLKEKLDIIQNEIGKRNVNWDLINITLSSISSFINDEVEDYRDKTSTLAYVIDFFDGNGKVLVKIVKLFLESGFDPKQNDFNNGYSVLGNLPWTSGDHYMIDAAKLLLDAGARVDEGTYDTIIWQEGDWTVGDPNYAMIITTFGIVADRAKKNSDYSDIQCWDYIKRKRLDKIEKFYVNNEKHKHYENYVLWFENIPLIVNEYCECYVNPYLINDIDEFTDVTKYYSSVIGKKLRNLKYMDAYTVHLYFYNNKKLIFHCPSSVGTINILLQEKASPIELGTEITCVKFRGGREYAEFVRTYRQNSVYLCSNDSVYQITSSDYSDIPNSKLNITKVNKSFVKEMEESIRLENGKIIDYYLYDGTNDECAVCIKCSKGYLYIKDNGYNELLIFMSPKYLKSVEISRSCLYAKNSNLDLLKIDEFKVIGKDD